MAKVKQGYKQTEVGVIPEGWAVFPLGEILSIRHGKSQKDIEVSIGKYPILATGGKIGETNSYLYNKPSVLIGRKGTINKPQYIESPFWTVDTLFYSEIKKNYHPKFLYYKFCLIDWEKFNEASGVPSLNSKTIEHINIEVPRQEEQTVIAKALSDVDSLMESLTQLIAKKRAIKTATMQQLLTGKQRLQGFMDAWKVKKLGGVCRYQNGTALEKYFNNQSGYKVISIGNYSTGGYFVETGTYINEAFIEDISKFILKKDELAMILNDKTAIGAIIGRVILIDTDNYYVFNQRTMRLSIKNMCSIVPKFLYYLINNENTHQKLVSLAKPGTQIYINTDDVLDLDLFLPEFAEQTAIATILSDMDTEIDALEKRLKKTRAIKQGMMQTLLTGKIRLLSQKELMEAA